MSKIINIITLLSDWRFHSNYEILQVWWKSYRWAIWKLEKKWFVFEKQKQNWRLISSPEYVIHKNKIIVLDNSISWIDEEKEEPKTIWQNIKLLFCKK